MRRAEMGFTLIELMLVVGIIAVLAAFAYPSYQDHVERGRLSDARVLLADAATRLERCYSARGTYTGCNVGITNSASGIYELEVSAQDNAYTIKANRVKITGANQCGKLTLTQAGVQNVEGASWDAARCWQ
ncbi:fimbrial protein pilin [Isoalcanivorax pacificus W11-5]|uniref:Fimbrial protein pilin n=1 Tax=Isoalcanivorax pacificus W11-5 TaxID=391936 RepID=A0A0B4XKL6_9GAMM|nr:type IV pilin protein [Isoalcanivorax pacificus]AJD47073.1 fimbrial protein pilin [Isoalcanivorax pacificus W11-5]